MDAARATVDDVERHGDREHDHQDRGDGECDTAQSDKRCSGAAALLRLALERFRSLHRMLDRVDDALRLLLEIRHVWVILVSAIAPLPGPALTGRWVGAPGSPGGA